MSDAMTMTFVLTGAMRGKTCSLTPVVQGSTYNFKDGMMRVTNSPQNLHTLAKYVAACFAAYPLGSVELDVITKREAKNGQLQDDGSSRSGNPAQVHPQVQHEGGGPAAQSAALLNGVVGAQAGNAGLVPDGNGLRPGSAGLSETSDQVEAIQMAIRKLDAKDAACWTESGKPAVAAVAKVAGDETITRAMIDAAMPGYNRAVAELS